MADYLKGTVEQSPKEAGFDEDKLARLADGYAGLVDKGRVQGAGFLLARRGKVFAHQTCGRLSLEPGREAEAMKPDSIKRIASITKIITATAVMQLVENGVLWLEQPVGDLIPEFKTDLHKGIKLWHLLTHTSGLAADGGYFNEPYPLVNYGAWDQPDWVVKAVLAGPLQNVPGEAWNYCTTGFNVLAEVVSRASGQHFNDYVETHIFQPLGMTRSFLAVPPSLHSEVIISSDRGRASLAAPVNPQLCPNGGGGAYSTLGDLNRLAQVFLHQGQWDGRRILSKKTVAEMVRNQLVEVPSFHWGLKLKHYRQGLGWGFFADGNTVGPATYNHEGWGWCSLFVDPVEDFTFISFLGDSAGWDPDLMVKPRTIAFSGIL